MCGIIGWKDFEINKHFDLLTENKKRGVYSQGSYCLDTKKVVKTQFLGLELSPNQLLHFRAPTTNSDKQFIYEENYPLEYNGYKLMGNGVINYAYFQSIKNEENNNDLFYILKNIAIHGFKYIKQIQGVFALVIISPDNKVYLIRKDYPLYISQNLFSSVEFPDSTLLKQGVLYNWTENKQEMIFDLESIYFLDF